MSNPLTSILERLVHADLPPATIVVATRLLTLAEWTPSGHGNCMLTWDEYAALSFCIVRRTARRHLTSQRITCTSST